MKSYGKKLLLALSLFIVLGTLVAAADWFVCLPGDTVATYVGRKTCGECHQGQDHGFSGSDHDLAMGRATEETVLGPFDGGTFAHDGVTSTMFRREGKFFVNTQGPDGQMTDFEVKYTFGVDPMQQYMVEMPSDYAKLAKSTDKQKQGVSNAGLPRIQVLPVTWDIHKKQWFHVNPDETTSPGDIMHWTGWTQNWNQTCGLCHSTNLRKHFNADEGQFHTTFSEINVSCEACHGPGSTHVELARSASLFWDRKLGYGLAKLKVKSSRPQLETCASCHSREVAMVSSGFTGGEKYSDHFGLARIDEPLYYADGQVLDEVYVYGSFLQSKMYRENVRCSDCHDPHTTRLKRQGNRLCTECHTTAKYDTPNHHHHAVGSTGAACVECHMPDRKYMVIDARRDHSLRVPRPDLSLKIDTPNACTGCHLDPKKQTQADDYPRLLDLAHGNGLNRFSPDEASEQQHAAAREKLRTLDQWAAGKVAQWYGTERRSKPHYGEVFYAARHADAQLRDKAESGLIELATDSKQVGPIVRATAVSLLGGYESSGSRKAIIAALGDSEPMVRAAATEGLVPDQYDKRLVPMLRDPARLVRAGTVGMLVGQRWRVREKDDALFRREVAEYREALEAHADSAFAQRTLAGIFEYYGATDRAIAAYETSIRLRPDLWGTRINLANHYDRRNRPADARKLREEEVKLNANRAKYQPGSAMIHFDYAMALYRVGRIKAATVETAKACKLSPHVLLLRMTLAEMYEKQGNWKQAIEQARELKRRWPKSEDARATLRRIVIGAQRGPRRNQMPR